MTTAKRRITESRLVQELEHSLALIDNVDYMSSLEDEERHKIYHKILRLERTHYARHGKYYKVGVVKK